MPSCPILGSTNATALVNTGWQFFNQQAIQFNSLATGLIGALKDYSADPISFNYTWTLPGNPNGFVTPVAPVAPDLTFKVAEAPSSPPPTGFNQVNFAAIPMPSYGGAPTSLANFPNISAPSADYGDAPSETSITLPSLPSITNPNAPTFYNITLPAPAAVTLPTFNGTAPTVGFSVPNIGISFSPKQYASTELGDIQSRLSQMLSGTTGLPAAVETALFARGRAREDMLAAKAVQESTEEFANRGFTLPPGALAARIAEVRQENQNKTSSLSRDVYVQAQTVAIENLRFCVTQGILLEGKMMDTYMHLQDLILQAQRAMVDAAVAIFNAQVSLFNAQQQAYAVAAQVYRDQIQGELAKVEVYKAQVDGQRLVGEVNKDLVAIYEAQIRAVMALVEQYKAQIEGVKAVTEVDRNRVEAFRARVSAFGESVHAYVAQWDGYKSQVDGDLGRARVFESQVNAYATSVRAATETNNSLVAQGQLQIRAQELALQGWRGTLDRYIAEVKAESDRISAGAQVYDGKARVYAASGQIAAAEADADTRAFQAVVEAGRAYVEVSLKNAEMKIQQLVQLSAQKVEALRGAAQTASQLGAGAMSAVHFAAEARDSNALSTEVGCRTDYQYIGTIS